MVRFVSMKPPAKMSKPTSLFVIFFSLFVMSEAVFEDQVGKFDWRQQYVGKTLFAHFDSHSQSSKKLFLATDKNIFASFNSRTGELFWRHVDKAGPEGTIDILLLHGQDALMVVGGGRLLRSWDTNMGGLNWEAVLDTGSFQAACFVAMQDTVKHVAVLKKAAISLHYLTNGHQKWVENLPDSDTVQYQAVYSGGEEEVYVLGVVPNSHLTIIAYSLEDGEIIKQRSVEAPWLSSVESSCVVVGHGVLMCVDTATLALYALPIQAEEAPQFNQILLQSLDLEVSPGFQPVLVSSQPHPARSPISEFFLQLGPDHHVLLQLNADGYTIAPLRDFHGGVPELLVGLSYNATTGRLSVELIKGSHFRNLAINRPPDTYGKLTLLNSVGQEISRCKTSVRRGQPNPVYKETFVFQVALFQLCDVTLMVSIYNRRSMKRKEMVGWLALGQNSSGEEEQLHWLDMKECKGQQVCRWHVLLEA